MMRPPWTIWRVVGAAFTVCLLGFATKCFVDARRFNQQFAEWEAAKPMDAPVDLSTSGELVVPFHQTCSSAHSEVVALRVSPSVLQSTTVTQLLQGLKARLEIFQKPDTNPVESAEAEVLWKEDTLDGAIPIFFVSPFRKGEYEAKLTVAAGAPSLKGTHQTLEGRYLLCGLEAMPASVAHAAGIASSVLGVLAGAILFYRLARVPPRSKTTLPTAPSNDGTERDDNASRPS